MSEDDKSLFDRLKERGETVFGQISGELMQNEHFVKAMQGALEGKQKLDRAVGRALKTMNVPTRSEVKRAVSRIESLEAEVAGLKEKLKTAGRKPGAARGRAPASSGSPRAKAAAKKGAARSK
jgi:polyhydroxyalkanoate synthesis regulator phasin